MDKTLEPKIEERLRGLCKQVSVANSLDEELREELFGHMEDKLLAYLNGEEPVTEDDALILVREHFGDPGVVKGMLREVHAQEAGISLARRLVAGLALAIGLDIGMYLVFSLVTLGLVAQAAWAPTATTPGNPNFDHSYVHPPWAVGAAAVSWNAMGLADALNTLLSGLALLVWPFIFWRVLRHWGKKAESGESVWFRQWALWRMLVFVLLLFFLRDLLPGIMTREAVPKLWGGLSSMLVPWRVSLVLHCIVWLWWTDQAPRRLARLLCAICMVCVVHVLRLANFIVPPSIALVFGDGAFLHEWTLHTSWGFNGYVFSTAVQAVTSSVRMGALYGLASLALYFAVLYLAKRNTPAPGEEV